MCPRYALYIPTGILLRVVAEISRSCLPGTTFRLVWFRSRPDHELELSLEASGSFKLLRYPEGASSPTRQTSFVRRSEARKVGDLWL
jgi:hypothetical protein